jgi:prephenate dehydratase
MGELDIAAIASEEAAERFGLKKLEGHINQSNTNTTRFAVFSRSQKAVTPKDNHFIMLFTVKNEAGSLGKAISVIGDHGFNLKALKSRPTKELIWDYYFYAEGEGNINSEQGKIMLKEEIWAKALEILQNSVSSISYDLFIIKFLKITRKYTIYSAEKGIFLLFFHIKNKIVVNLQRQANL